MSLLLPAVNINGKHYSADLCSNSWGNWSVITLLQMKSKPGQHSATPLPTRMHDTGLNTFTGKNLSTELDHVRLHAIPKTERLCCCHHICHMKGWGYIHELYII